MRQRIPADGRNAGEGIAHASFDALARAVAARWNGIRLSTTPVDRAAAAEGVRIAYREAGLSPPCLVWHEGPLSLAAAWASASPGIGASVIGAIMAAPYRRVNRRLEMSARPRVAMPDDRGGLDTARAVSAAMRDAVIEDASAVRLSLPRWLHRLRSSLADRRRPPGFAASGASQHELCSLGLTTNLLSLLEPHIVPGLRGLSFVAENAGWFLPHAHVCWLAERPVRLSFDRWGRLHSSSGPALRYRDGWSFYAWKGTRVPAWTIEEPQQLTLCWIDAQIDPLIRHAMIDIFTPERFVEAGGANCVAAGDGCKLWVRNWSYRGSVIDAWAALEFPAQPSGRTFRCVPAHLRTLEEALSWLFGPSGESRRRASQAGSDDCSQTLTH